MEKTESLQAVLAKGKHFASPIEERHGGSTSDPLVNGKFISISMSLDATIKAQGRMLLEEVCVYKVEDEKV